MKNVIAVGLGGFLGSIARYATGILVERFFDPHVFPVATLLVNVVGCFLIGLLGGFSENTNLISPPLQLFLIVGVLGGFTTYSAFAYQSAALANEGRLALTMLNIFAHVVMGLGAVWAGEAIGKQI